jgi:FKBP-type peptidyl-prolyl cis-trans isomerase 2
VVTLEYTVHLENGRLVDSTGHCGPIAVMIGAGQLFPALEDRIVGMRPGETRTLQIPPEDAYGVRDERLVRVIPRANLAPDLDLVIGEQYRLKGDETVRADFNSPNAGQALVATVTVVAVRLPTADEERRGQV